MAKKAATDQPPKQLNPQPGNALPGPSSVPEFSLPHLPLMISAAATFLLCTSVSYQLGYLSAISTDLMPFFSIQDIIVNSLSLIPLFVVVLPIALILAKWIPPNPSPIGSNPPSLSTATIVCLIGIVTGLLASIFYRMYNGWMAGVTLMWISLLFLGAPSSQRQPILVFIIFAMTLGLVFGLGGAQARGDLATGNYKYMLTTKEGSHCVKLLRVGSEIILVQEINGRVSVVPNSQVEILRRIGDLPHDPLLTFDEFRAWLRGESEQPKVSPQCLERT